MFAHWLIIDHSSWLSLPGETFPVPLLDVAQLIDDELQRVIGAHDGQPRKQRLEKKTQTEIDDRKV